MNRAHAAGSLNLAPPPPDAGNVGGLGICVADLPGTDGSGILGALGTGVIGNPGGENLNVDVPDESPGSDEPQADGSGSDGEPERTDPAQDGSGTGEPADPNGGWDPSWGDPLTPGQAQPSDDSPDPIGDWDPSWGDPLSPSEADGSGSDGEPERTDPEENGSSTDEPPDPDGDSGQPDESGNNMDDTVVSPGDDTKPPAIPAADTSGGSQALDLRLSPDDLKKLEEQWKAEQLRNILKDTSLTYQQMHWIEDQVAELTRWLRQARFLPWANISVSAVEKSKFNPEEAVWWREIPGTALVLQVKPPSVVAILRF